MGEEESVHSLSICFPDRFVILILWLQFFCRKGGTSKSLTLTLPKTNRKPSLIPTPFQWRILFQASNFHVIRQFRGFGAWRLQSFFFDSLDSTPESLERMHDLLAHRLKLTGWWFRNPKKTTEDVKTLVVNVIDHQSTGGFRKTINSMTIWPS